MVNFKSAGTFNGILETWRLIESAKKQQKDAQTAHGGLAFTMSALSMMASYAAQTVC